MMKTKRMIALLLAGMLTLSSLAGCAGKDKTAGQPGADPSAQTGQAAGETAAPAPVAIADVAPPELTGVDTSGPADGIGKPGVDFVELPTGEANDWGDTEIPLFNPLGAKALYGGARFYPDSSNEILTLTGYKQRAWTVYGNSWDMEIRSKDYSAAWLKWYAKSLGAEILPTTPDYLAFHIVQDEHTEWYIDTDGAEDGYGCRLYVTRMRVLPVGEALTIESAAMGDKTSYIFYTHRTPGKKQTANVVMTPLGEDSFAYVEAAARLEEGECRWDVSADWRVDHPTGDRVAIDDMPISPVPLRWTLRWNRNGRFEPKAVTFTMAEMDSLQEIEWGDAAGGIRVVGAPPGSASAYVTGMGASVRHTGMGVDTAYPNALYSVPDADGNAVIPAPAGYYELRVGGKLLRNDDPGSTFRLIPVSAGKITEVSVPSDLKTSYEQLARSMAAFDKQTGGISILSAEDKGDTAVVSLLVNDPAKRDVFPEPGEFQVTEYGLPGKVIDVVREPAQANVVLVLDSSGSMGDFMAPTVEAAKRFVESLPEQTSVQLVQFQQTITAHKGTTKAEALAALDKVRSIGATSLYDATDTALTLLKDKERAFAVVFSDGADSREPGVDGAGSKMTKEQILKNIADSGVTVLTIGFGEGHDPATLIAMGDASSTGSGAYFAAADETALDSAFAAVAGKFGNQFTVTYERPTMSVDVASSVPVVSVMLDISGSMNPYVNSVRVLLHDFIQEMPKDCMMQFAAFSDSADYLHATTDDRAALLQAVGMSQRAQAGGTNVLTALQSTYEMLAPLPTVKKNAVFISDEALGGDARTDKLLGQLKEGGIRTLFLSMSEPSERLEAVYIHAAEVSGGEYLITTDLEKIQAKVDEMLAQVNVPVREDGGMQLGVSLDCLTEDGTRMAYSAVSLLNPETSPFSARTSAGATVKPNTLKVRLTDERYVIYDQKTAQLLSGGGSPDADTRITARVALTAAEPSPETKPASSSAAPEPALENTVSETVKAGFTGENLVCGLTVKEAFYLDLFQGMAPPKNKQYLALDLDLTFNDREKKGYEAYQIPTILNHFFVSVNGKTAPASKATWMASEPLVTPGEVQLSVKPGETKSGVLVFIVDRTKDEYVGQLALHFYDTSYGHIEIPITGTLPKNLSDIAALPKSQPAKITDAFSLTITGSGDYDALGGVALPRESNRDNPRVAQESSFRVLEGRFDSQVQALLNIDPMQRFLYAIETDQGPLVTKMNEVVYSLPMGFSGETMLAPGAANSIRMPFQIASGLANAPSYLFGDISGGALNLPVTEGTVYQTGSLGKTYSHEYFDLTVNALSVSPDSQSRVIMDFTITDKKDGMGLGGVSGMFTMVNSAEAPNFTTDPNGRIITKGVNRKGLGDFSSDEYAMPKGVVTPDIRYTDELLYGAHETDAEWGVFDGQTRRGLLVFYTGGNNAQFTLQSDYLPELALSPSTEIYPYPALLALRQQVERDKQWDIAFDKAVTAAVNRWNANHPKPAPVEVIGLSEEETVIDRTPAPSASGYGAQLIQSARTDKDFQNLMNALTWLPGGYYDEYLYSPEATLTQGWGGHAELCETARALLAGMGRSPKIKWLKLLPAGKENLKRMAGNDRASIPDLILALSYTDDAGASKLYVPIFRRDITELEGLCYLPIKADTHALRPRTGDLSITVRARLTGEKLEQTAGFGDFGGLFGSLAGDDGSADADGEVYETVTLFKRDGLDLSRLGMDAIDISYVPVKKSANGDDDIVMAAVETADGLLTDKACFIDTAYYDVESVTVKLYSRGCEGVNTTYLKDGERLTDIMQTLAWNLAELPEAAVKSMEATSAATVKNAGEVTDNYSIVRWNTHETASRLMRAFTRFDAENEQKLGVAAARMVAPIAFMVTARSSGGDALLSVDMMHHQNEVLYAADEKASRAYRTLLGMFASQVEGEVLPDGRGRSYLDVWATLPDEAGFINVNANMKERAAAATALRDKSFPELLCRRLEDDKLSGSNNAFLIPTHAGKLDGEARWAWLEVDTRTGDLISVFDTGERSGMAAYMLGLTPKNAVEFTAGAMVGIACSHFSVAAYSLELDNYEDIMKAAGALAVYTYQRLDQTMKGNAKLKDYVTDPLGTLGGDLKDAANGAVKERTGIDVDALYKLYKGEAVPGVQPPPEPNFTEGFKAVVEVYFGVTIE